MEVSKLALGELQTNCFIIHNEEKHAVIIDPGAQKEKVIQFIDKRGLKVKAILLTHCHFDHIGASDALASHYNVEVYAHKGEADAMQDSKANLSQVFGTFPILAEVDVFVEHNQVIDLGDGFQFQCIEIPGHTEHSICYYHYDGHLFTGDTLFNDSIGRTDFYSGDNRDLGDNIANILFLLPEATFVYPGHGLITTLAREKKYNIHVRGF